MVWDSQSPRGARIWLDRGRPPKFSSKLASGCVRGRGVHRRQTGTAQAGFPGSGPPDYVRYVTRIHLEHSQPPPFTRVGAAGSGERRERPNWGHRAAKRRQQLAAHRRNAMAECGDVERDGRLRQRELTATRRRWTAVRLQRPSQRRTSRTWRWRGCLSGPKPRPLAAGLLRQGTSSTPLLRATPSPSGGPFQRSVEP